MGKKAGTWQSMASGLTDHQSNWHFWEEQHGLSKLKSHLAKGADICYAKSIKRKNCKKDKIRTSSVTTSSTTSPTK